MSKLLPTGKWYYSFDADENWDLSEGYDTPEDALADGREAAPEYADENGMEPDEKQRFLQHGKLFVGQGYRFVPEVDADFVAERIQEDADDECGEYSHGYLDGPPLNSGVEARKRWRDQIDDLSKRLTDVFNQWAKETNNEPFFSMIDDISEERIQEDDNA